MMLLHMSNGAGNYGVFENVAIVSLVAGKCAFFLAF